MNKLAQTANKSQPEREMAVGNLDAAAPVSGGADHANTLVEAKEFIDILFADADPDTEVVCVSKGFEVDDNGTPGMGFWNVGDDEKPFTRWKPARQKQAWYFCVSTVNGERNAKGTAVLRKTSSLVRYHVLVLDDIGTKATPPPVAPTYRITTSLADDGTPNEQWGYALFPKDRFKRYEGLLEYCHENTWGDGGAGGCYRIMRLPGSTNLKPGKKNYKSHVTLWEPDRVWELDDLAGQLGCTDLDVRETKTKGNKRTLHGAAAQVIDVDDIDPLFIWLKGQSLVVADQGGDFADVICPWKSEHTTGGDTAGYSPLGRGEGDWVQSRGFRCLHEHCKGRGFKDAMKEWAGVGAPRVSGVDPLPWLQHRYTYIGQGSKVADLHQRPLGGDWIWEFEDWGKMHKGRVIVPGRDQPVEMKTAFLEHKATRKVTGTKYWPVRAAEDIAIFERNGQEFVNTYTPPNHAYTVADPDVFLNHVKFLLPDPIECDLFIDWLAHKLQNPELRSYAVVMIAEDGYGVGRSWLRAMMVRVLQGKVQTATLPQLIGKGTAAETNFNDWATECQLIVIEEARDNMSKDDFYHGYETFKTNVDTRVTHIRVNPKYGRTRDDFMFFNALIFSNHSDALAIPTNDRRVAVLTNPSVMADPEYYDKLEGALTDDEAARVYWFLMERDVSKFDRIYPPMTKGKEMMMDQNMLPSEAIRDHLLDACDGDLLTKKMLRSRVITAALTLDYEKIASDPGSIVRALWGKMGNLRGKKNGARYSFGGDPVEVRAIRNVENWRELDIKRASDEFVAELAKNDKSGGRGLMDVK